MEPQGIAPAAVRRDKGDASVAFEFSARQFRTCRT
jgi:hypothetical protein